MATRVDALAALGLADDAEREAPAFLQPGVIHEPFALRTLGIVRRDADLPGRADERFGALGLDWHRARTETLVAGL